MQQSNYKLDFLEKSLVSLSRHLTLLLILDFQIESPSEQFLVLDFDVGKRSFNRNFSKRTAINKTAIFYDS